MAQLLFAILALQGFEERIDREIERLREGDIAAREQAVAALVEFGEPALPHLRKRLSESQDAEVRARLLAVLDQIDHGVLARSRWVETASVEPFDGPVRRFAISPDGRRAASVGQDATLILWDVARLAPIASFVYAAHEWTFLGFSPDSRILVAHSSHPPVGLRAWNAEDGTELRDWKETKLGSCALLRHASGATILRPPDFWSREVLVSSTSRLEPPPPLWRQRWFLSDDGKRLVTFDVQGLVGAGIPQKKRKDRLVARLWDLAEGTELAKAEWEEVVDESEGYFGDAAAFDGENLALARGGSVTVYRLADRAVLASFGRDVTALARRERRWITGHSDGTLRFWEGEREVAWMRGPAQKVRYLTVHRDFVLARTVQPGNWVGTPGPGHLVLFAEKEIARLEGGTTEGRLFDEYATLRTYEGLTRVYGRDGLAAEIQADPLEYDETDFRNIPALIGGSTLAYLRGGRLVFHDLRAKRVRGEVNAHHGGIRRLAWGPDGLLVRGDATSVLVDRLTGKTVRAFATSEVRWRKGRLLDLSSFPIRNPRVVATGGDFVAMRDAEDVVLFSEDGAREVRRFRFPGHVASPVALSADGRYLAAASHDGRRGALEVWDVHRGTTVFRKELEREAYPAEFLEFNREGTVLAARLRQVRFYTLEGEEIHRMFAGPAAMGEDEHRRSFAFLAEGKGVIAASHGGAVEIYDLAERRRILRFKAPWETYSHFVRVASSPTGRTFALFYPERDLVFWAALDRGPIEGARIETLAQDQPVDFLPEGHLVVLSKDGLEIWHAPTGGRALVLSGVRGDTVRTSPDGRRLAVARNARITLYERR